MKTIITTLILIFSIYAFCQVEETPAPKVKMSKAQLRSFILTETKEGGKLDFLTPIKGREMDGLQVKPGIFTTRISLAYYQWGRTAYALGVKNVKEALSIYTEFKGRDLNQRESVYIKMGFNQELEK